MFKNTYTYIIMDADYIQLRRQSNTGALTVQGKLIW